MKNEKQTDRRVQRIHYALVNTDGIFWKGMTLPTQHMLWQQYGSKSAAVRDGWRAVKITLYFDRPTVTDKPVNASTGRIDAL